MGEEWEHQKGHKRKKPGVGRKPAECNTPEAKERESLKWKHCTYREGKSVKTGQAFQLRDWVVMSLEVEPQCREAEEAILSVGQGVRYVCV